MKRVLACLLALSLTLIFVACGGNGDETTTTATTTAADTTTDPNAPTTTTDPNAPTTTTDPNAPTTTTKPDDTTTTKPGDPPTPAFVLPSGNDAILAYYNNGLTKTPGLKLVAEKRTLVYGEAVAKIASLNLVEDYNLHNNNDVKAKANYDRTGLSNPSNLIALNTGMIKDATAKMEGDDVVLTINLKDEKNAKPTKVQGGYVGLVDYDEAEKLIIGVATEMGKDVLKQKGGKVADDAVIVKTMDFTMSAGKYVVKMTKAGAIKSVSYSVKEGGPATATANSKYLLSVPATAKLDVALSAEYKA